MRSMTTRLFSGLAVSFGLALGFSFAASPASAQTGGFDSLMGKTQVAAGLNASFADAENSSLDIAAQGDGFYYIMPNFGVGGMLSLRKGGAGTPLVYGIGPAVEYFVPVSERGHVFGQAAVTLSGAENSGSTIGIGVNAGYRYFVSEDIAISARLTRAWTKDNVSGSNINSTASTNMLAGFALFF